MKRAKISPIFIFLAALFLFSFVFYLVRHFMTNLDEYDNLTAPYLMANHHTFYTQLFNMHFPLPYYWAYLFTPLWINALPSRAVALFRLSLLVLYLLVFLLTFIANRKPLSRFSFSLSIVLITFILPIYQGNLYLSDTFNALFLLAIFWLIIPVIFRWETINSAKLFLLVLFATLSFWTQPLFGILFLLPFFFISFNQTKSTFCLVLILNSIPLAFLFFSHQLKDFFDQAISFNFSVYSHFFPEQINHLSLFSQSLISFFNHQLYFLTHFTQPFDILNLLFQLSAIIFFIYVTIHFRSRTLIALLLLFVVSRIREVKIAPGQLFNPAMYPFVCLCLSSLSALVFITRRRLQLLSFGLVLIFSLLVFNLTSPIIKQSFNQNYNFDAFWSYRFRWGQDLASLTLPSEKVLVYPYDSDLYFFAHRQPIDRFIYWYPWINSVKKYKSERLTALSQNPPAAIFYDHLAYQNDPLFYTKLFPNLLAGYRQILKDNVTTNIWIRADLLYRLSSPYSVSQ